MNPVTRKRKGGPVPWSEAKVIRHRHRTRKRRSLKQRQQHDASWSGARSM
jgi:hypothetical protein